MSDPQHARASHHTQEGEKCPAFGTVTPTPGPRARLLLIGGALACTLVVAGTLLVVAGRMTTPTTVEIGPTAEASEGKAGPTESPSAVGYAAFGNDHVVLRHPEGWEPRGWESTDSAETTPITSARTLSAYWFDAPGGEHQVCFTVLDVRGEPERGAREHQEDWEVLLMESPGVSDWRRIDLWNDASAPHGWDTSHLEVTYRNTEWDRPDRWMLWRYTVVAEKGLGYYLQANVPASERHEYAEVVEEVFASFEPVL